MDSLSIGVLVSDHVMLVFNSDAPYLYVVNLLHSPLKLSLMDVDWQFPSPSSQLSCLQSWSMQANCLIVSYNPNRTLPLHLIDWVETETILSWVRNIFFLQMSNYSECFIITFQCSVVYVFHACQSHHCPVFVG